MSSKIFHSTLFSVSGAVTSGVDGTLVKTALVVSPTVAVELLQLGCSLFCSGVLIKGLSAVEPFLTRKVEQSCQLISL